MKTNFINTFKEGESFDSIFLLGDITVKQTKSQKDYWMLKLSDRTGTVTAKVWDVPEDTLLQRGDYVKVRAAVTSYRDELELNVKQIRKFDPERDGEDFKYEDFVPVGPKDRFWLMSELEEFVGIWIVHPGLRGVAKHLFDEPALHMAFRDCPAAMTIHQPYIGGLAEHVTNICHLIKAVSGVYQLNQTSLDVLYTAALYHDIGKIRELKWKTGIGYTAEGYLVGHIAIGLEILEGLRPLYFSKVEGDLEAYNHYNNLWLHLRHIIASHHLRLEWKSITTPQSREAYIFHLCDAMDAHNGLFDGLNKTEKWDDEGLGSWNPRLDGRPWRMPI